MSENKVIYSEADDVEMQQAFAKARDSFRYFWRELSWEFRRIVPALDLAVVKLAFEQETRIPGKPTVEYMWIDEINFDGDMVRGVLMNSPNHVTNFKNGDLIEMPLNRICDWLFASIGKTYGGFTIQLLRSRMDEDERAEHDEEWGLDFGDFNNIFVVRDQKEHPENLMEHPMSVNMGDSLKDFLKQHPAEITNQDAAGYTMLHRETIAGNKTIVEGLLHFGANTQAKTKIGKTALDFAKQLNWEHIVPLLETNNEK